MKKLIVVCDEKHKKYGNYLSQLISSEDDREESVVGVKDGEVVAIVWSEKDYQANGSQISSSQYVLFIGESKLIKEQTAHMEMVFSKYGMRYGWLGKQAVLTVDNNVPVKEYAEFLEFALSNQANIERIAKQREEKNIVDRVKESPMIGVKATDAAAAGIIWGLIGFAGFQFNKEIRGWQYSCATMKFYLSDLSTFLGL